MIDLAIDSPVPMIDRLDHLVLTVRDVAATRDFYVRGLGLQEQTSADGRVALKFGRQKFNLHESTGAPIVPRAHAPTPGSADFCFVSNQPLPDVLELLAGYPDRARACRSARRLGADAVDLPPRSRRQPG